MPVYKVQYWDKNDNNWTQHSVNETRPRAMRELFYLESCGKIVRVIHEGRIIAISEDEAHELPY